MSADHPKQALSDDLLSRVVGGTSFSGYLEHTVRRGDTLEKIAEHYHVSVAEIAELNGIRNRNLLYIGDILRVPVHI